MSYAVVDHYYSGQGMALLAKRNPDGTPQGFRPVGNVPDLKVSIKTSVLEHRESTTGQRAKDLRLTTDVSCDLSMTMENFIAQNLADTLRGNATTVAAGSASDEAVILYPGFITALKHINVSNLVVTGGVALTEYVDDETPYDYQANLVGGSFKINDGSVLALDKLGVAATAIAVGTTTELTIVNNAVAGGYATCRGFAGTDAADLNGKTFLITEADGTSMTLDVDTSAKTITTTGSKVVWDGMAATADYDYTLQYEVDAMTTGAQEYYLRFEGLNTAETNEPVVVEVFRISADILKELALISDKVQAFELAGSVLLDNTRMTGSKFFKATKLN